MIQQADSDASLLGWLCPSAPTSGLGEFGCLLAEYEVPVILVAVVVVGTLVRLGWQWWNRRQSSTRSLLVFPLSAPDGMESAVAMERRRQGDADRAERQRIQAPAPILTDPGRRSPAHEGRDLPSGYSDGDGSPPADGTLQLLPGRLELVKGGGAATAPEVRFVRVPGREPEVTFGRDEGDPFLHVRLDIPTVSRLQARLRFQGGRWTLLNESRTNPTSVEGEPLPPGGAGRRLSDGDRVEMGTVVYRFHQPGATSEPEATTKGLPERSSWFTDQGRRSSNHDAVAVRTLSDGRELAVVCDGIGSNAYGRTASHLALDTLISRLEEDVDLPLEAGIRAAHRAIRTRVEEDPEMEGMGTTLVAALRKGGHYEIANVGDSRAYRLDPQGIHRLTEDHSFAAEVRRDGSMSEEELARSPWRNAITRHLGADSEVEVDVFGPFNPDESHALILCSDGLHGVLDDATIAHISLNHLARDEGVKEASQALGEEALRQGSDDNVSVIVMTFRPWAPVEEDGAS